MASGQQPADEHDAGDEGHGQARGSGHGCGSAPHTKPPQAAGCKARTHGRQRPPQAPPGSGQTAAPLGIEPRRDGDLAVGGRILGGKIMVHAGFASAPHETIDERCVGLSVDRRLDGRILISREKLGDGTAALSACRSDPLGPRLIDDLEKETFQ